MNTPLDQLLNRALQRPGYPVELGLERVARLLERAGNPQQGLRCIHVAGTNGKGSVIAFLQAILQAAGYRVATYTSPHLSHFTERITLAGQAIAEEEAAADLEKILALDEEGEATFFERTTAAAFLFFQRHEPDWVLLETGLGGRLDATNVVTPALSLITPIGLDHQEYLGDTVPEIAWEKAGILKKGVPAAADPGHRKAEAVLRVTAAGRGAGLITRGRGYDLALQKDHWVFLDRWGRLELPFPSLPGIHQVYNAGLAVAGLRLLDPQGVTLSPAVLADGVSHARWPGRLELFPGAPPVWLDGAHNPMAAKAVADSLPALAPLPLTVLFACLADKDHEGMIKALAPLTREVHLCPLPDARGRDPAQLAKAWQAHKVNLFIHQTPAEALARARQRTPAGKQLLVTGSLFLVGLLRPLIAGLTTNPP